MNIIIDDWPSHVRSCSHLTSFSGVRNHVVYAKRITTDSRGGRTHQGDDEQR